MGRPVYQQFEGWEIQQQARRREGEAMQKLLTFHCRSEQVEPALWDNICHFTAIDLASGALRRHGCAVRGPSGEDIGYLSAQS